MNLFKEQKQTHRQTADVWLPRGRGLGEGRIRSLELVEASYHI